MDKIVLYNQNGQKFDVDVIRYFSNNDNRYLIFGLNEISNGYIQLYLSKAAYLDEQLTLVSVTDDKEWQEFKAAIQKIVTNNRNNIPIDCDLDYSELDGMKVSSFRIFRLKEEDSKILSANKNVQDYVVKLKVIDEQLEEDVKPEIKEPTNLLDASAQDTGMSIEEILKKVSDGAKNAREEAKAKAKPKKTIDDLLNSQNNSKENDEYKKKYEKLLDKVKHLEDENIRLINELIEAKAQIETIKDIIN